MPLSRGASRLLKLLRWYTARFSTVYPFLSSLGSNLGCHPSTVRRWSKELQTADLLRICRRGPHSALYELLEVHDPVGVTRKLAHSSIVARQAHDSPQVTVTAEVTVENAHSLAATGTDNLHGTQTQPLTRTKCALFSPASISESSELDILSGDSNNSARTRESKSVAILPQEKATRSGCSGNVAQGDPAKGSVWIPSETSLSTHSAESGSSRLARAADEKRGRPVLVATTPPKNHAVGATNGTIRVGGGACFPDLRELRRDEQQHLVNRYSELIERWRPFALQKVGLGAQLWISHVESGTIRADNIDEAVFAGLERWKRSVQWNRGRVHHVSTWLGWSSDGRPSAPLWDDWPAEIEGEGY